MNDQETEELFRNIFRFLNQFEYSTAGRAAASLTTDEEAQLQDLLNGRMPQAERARFMVYLSTNSAALERLAELLRTNRPKPFSK